MPVAPASRHHLRQRVLGWFAPGRCHRRRSVTAALLLVLLSTAPARAAQRDQLWGVPGQLQLLRFVQGSAEPLRSSRYTLLIRPQDHPGPLALLLLDLPPSFDSGVVQASLRLCRMPAGPQVKRSHCQQPLPARIEPQGSARLLILPDQPLAGDASYGLMLRLFNPSTPGFHPLRLYGAATATGMPVYLGTWLITILEENE